MKTRLILVLAASLIAGCSKPTETSAPAPTESPATTQSPAPKPAEMGTATITGKVLFKGETPEPKKIQVSADPKCAEMHGDKPLTSEEIVVNDDGTLRNVFVCVKGGLEGRT